MAMNNNESLKDTITPKSDQLNADDLIDGPLTITIVRVTKTSAEQPVSVFIEGRHKTPYKPCKGMRNVMIQAWGDTGYDSWGGRQMTLYRNPDVRYSNERVGGIEISHMTDIERPTMTFKIRATRGQKRDFTIRRLDTEQPQQRPAQAHEVTAEDLKELFDRVGKHSSTKEERESIYRGFGVTGPIGKPTSWTRANIDAGLQWVEQMESVD